MVKRIDVLTSPYSCYVNLTNECNIRCLHCLGSYENRLDSELSLNEWKSIFDQIIKNKVFYINISGGEPTVHPNFTEIISYLSEIGLHFIITTNGVFSKKIRDIIIKNKEYLIGIKVSLDGYNAESHCFLRRDKNNKADYRLFDITLKNILFFKKNKIPLTIATVIHKKNITNFKEFVKLIKKIDPISWFICPILPSGRGNINTQIKEDYYYFDRDFWNNIVEECNKNRINVKLVDLPFDMKSESCIDYYECGGTLNFCEINSDGIVSPCTLARTIIPGQYIKFESLKEKSLKEIWNGKAFNKFRSYMTLGCEGCKAFDKCYKCIPQSFRYFKNGSSPTPYCIRNAKNLNLKMADYYKKELIKQGVKI